MTELAIDAVAELRKAGTATVYEARGRHGVLDVDLIQLIPGSCVAGPARTVRCAQNDNRGVHELVSRIRPGEVAVLTMPEPAPVALIGDLLVTQLRERGAAAILVDASVRDVEDLRKIGLPIWTRWIRIRGAAKDTRGEVDVSVEIGGTTIRTGDIVILDADGVVVVPRERAREVLEDARGARAERERVKREKLAAGALSYDLDGLRARRRGRHDDGEPLHDVAHIGHVELLTPELDAEPGVLRRRARHGGRGARRVSRSSSAASATTSATASSSTESAQRRARPHGPAASSPEALERRVAAIEQRGPRPRLERRRPRPRAGVSRSRDPGRSTCSRSTTRPSATCRPSDLRPALKNQPQRTWPRASAFKRLEHVNFVLAATCVPAASLAQELLGYRALEHDRARRRH